MGVSNMRGVVSLHRKLCEQRSMLVVMMVNLAALLFSVYVFWKPAENKVIRFSEIATSQDPVTDKVTAHGYETLYDIYLQPTNQKVRLLEIGLGCDMAYGPGASAVIWPELFPNGDIWFAELNEECVNKYWSSSKKWRYVTGDQSDEKVLQRWIQETGGKFDFIIDDGGHTNQQIWNSFSQLFFNALNAGGVYFIEDLHVGRYSGWHSNGLPHDNSSVMLDVLTDWIDQLVVKSMKGSGGQVVRKTYKHILPEEILRIDCVKDMCAITKSKAITGH